jgi:hypothetical protein
MVSDVRENLEDDERSGRPTAVRTPDMIETVRELILTDRRMTLRMMGEEVLSPLVQRIRRVRPQFQGRGSWFLLHDNARPHTVVPIKPFLAKQGIPDLNPPIFSTDLSPPDFFLFPKMKSVPKRRRFEDTEDIKRHVTKKLLALHANEFKKCFQQFYERAQIFVTYQGDYFEEC